MFILFFIFKHPKNRSNHPVMKNFLIYTLATIVGIILTSFLFFIIMVASLGALVSSGNKPVTLSTHNVLVLKAGVPIPDRTNPNPW